ncbi:DUF645 family protein, partial [Vibrio cholerae]
PTSQLLVLGVCLFDTFA